MQFYIYRIVFVVRHNCTIARTLDVSTVQSDTRSATNLFTPSPNNLQALQCMRLIIIQDHLIHIFSIFLYHLVEKKFIKHARTLVKQYTENVIKGLDKELTVDQANRITSIGDKCLDLAKPNVNLLFHRIGSLVDKHMGIPDAVSIESASDVEPNTNEANLAEMYAREQLDALDKSFIQQQIMLEALKMESDHYDNVLMPQMEVDMQLCDLFEQRMKGGNPDISEHIANANALLAEESIRERSERMRRSL